ncbi:beta-lactamase/transpeptidase-like protein [Aspergillus cavernicola]|uniref:Beta-lactamase/transpeptidase-like protein n=1 Tax=Aspergillus cavernicola TaxID=176166 RepID=A0ABR4HC80_9EURO
MFIPILFLSSLAAAQFQSPIPIPSYSSCPPNGPLLPHPTSLSTSKHVRTAATNLTISLDAAIRGTLKAGWDVNNVTFSVAMISPDANPNGGGGGSNDILWEYHHRATAATQGTEYITGDTQYLIGSVSKVFTDLLVLESGIDIHQSVTRFLPELATPNSYIVWPEISLKILGEHLAGISPNYVYEIFPLQSVFEAFGFPSLSPDDYPPCGICTRILTMDMVDMLEGLVNKLPVAPPNSRPIYSSLSFAIQALALERTTNQTYAELLKKFITGPLNMTNTGPSPGTSSKAAIPEGQSSWGGDFGVNTAGGGLYSTVNDLAAFLSQTLAHNIPTANDTGTRIGPNKWLKPTSATGSTTTLIGLPWEIHRTTHLLTPPQTVDLYTKSGGAVGYAAQIALIPSHNLGVIVLTASPVGSKDLLYQSITQTFLSAVEAEAREQAAAKYTGVWVSADAVNTSTDSRCVMSVAMDSGSGLRLTSLTRGNASVLDGIQSVWDMAYASIGFGILAPEVRIYPSGIEEPVSEFEARHIFGRITQDEDLVRQDWRINFDIAPLDGVAMSELPGQAGWSESPLCLNWQAVDWMQYGGEPVDRVVFVVGRESGRVYAIEVPVLREVLVSR